MKTWKHWTFAAVIATFVIIVVFTACDNGSSSESREFTVTFDLDGGNIAGNTASVEIKVKSGETIINLPNPQKIDNGFIGWFTGKNGTDNEFTATTSVTKDLTVYAKWETPELRTQTIYIDFGESPYEWVVGIHNITVEGKLFAYEWDGLAQRFQTALQANYDMQTNGAVKSRYTNVFASPILPEVKIVVGKTSEFDKWSVSNVFHIYWNFDYVNSLSDEELASNDVIRVAVFEMNNAPLPDNL